MRPTPSHVRIATSRRPNLRHSPLPLISAITGPMRTTASFSGFKSFLQVSQNGWIGLVVIVPQNVADAGDCTPRDVRLIFL